MNRIGDWGLVLALFLVQSAIGDLSQPTLFSLSYYIDESLIFIVTCCILIGAIAKSAQQGLHTWQPQAMAGPTPVSALIHAATMVRKFAVKQCELFYYDFAICWNLLKSSLYILVIRMSNDFLKFNNYEIYKKILCSSIKSKLINNKNNFLIKERDNQQVTKTSQHSVFQHSVFEKLVGTSETACEITFDFKDYLGLRVDHQKNKKNKKFQEWLIGFTEGDGSFIVSKGKVYFDITQSISDIQVLYYIKKQQGFGKVLLREESHRRVGVFYITSKENFRRLICLFNGNLCSDYKRNQFSNWLSVYNKQYNEDIPLKICSVIPTLNNGWLSGIIDAEGSFSARIRECKTYKLGKSPHLSLSIYHKEPMILDQIKNLFNPRLKTGYDKSWQGYRIIISSFKKQNIIRQYLTNYKLKTRKQISFLKFSNILKRILNKQHLETKGLNHLICSASKSVNKLV